MSSQVPAKPAQGYWILQKKKKTLQAFGKIFIANLMDCCSCNHIVSLISAAGVAAQTPAPRKSRQEVQFPFHSLST